MSTNRTIGGHTLTPQMNDFMDAVEVNFNVKGSALAGYGKTIILRSVENAAMKKAFVYFSE